MNVVRHPSAGTERFLTAGELAEHLSVSARQVRRWTALGMPCARWGRGTVRVAGRGRGWAAFGRHATEDWAA